MPKLTSRLAEARTVETPAAVMRTLASPGFGPVFPCSVWRTEIPAGTSGPSHVIDVDHLVVLVEGTLQVQVEGVEKVLSTGDAIKLPSGTRRTIRAGDEARAVTITVGEAGGRARVGDGEAVVVPWSV